MNLVMQKKNPSLHLVFANSSFYPGLQYFSDRPREAQDTIFDGYIAGRNPGYEKPVIDFTAIVFTK